jgi:hypothetical protein
MLTVPLLNSLSTSLYVFPTASGTKIVEFIDVSSLYSILIHTLFPSPYVSYTKPHCFLYHHHTSQGYIASSDGIITHLNVTVMTVISGASQVRT